MLPAAFNVLFGHLAHRPPAELQPATAPPAA